MSSKLNSPYYQQKNLFCHSFAQAVLDPLHGKKLEGWQEMAYKTSIVARVPAAMIASLVELLIINPFKLTALNGIIWIQQKTKNHSSKKSSVKPISSNKLYTMAKWSGIAAANIIFMGTAFIYGYQRNYHQLIRDHIFNFLYYSASLSRYNRKLCPC